MTTREYVFPCVIGSVTASSGTGEWVDPANVFAYDLAFARATVAAGGNSLNLDCLSIKPSSPGWVEVVARYASQFTLTGIVVQIDREASGASSIRDLTAQRLDDGATAGTNIADTSTLWPTTRDAATYGSSQAVWGSFPTIAEIADGSFGFRFAAHNNAGVSAEAWVDRIHVQLIIEGPDTLITSIEGIDDAALNPNLYQPRTLLSSVLQTYRLELDGRARRTPNIALAPARMLQGLIWLVEMSSVNTETGEETSYYFCNGRQYTGFLTRADDDPALRLYRPQLINALDFTEALYGPRRVSGSLEPSTGTIVLDNTGGLYDNLDDEDVEFTNREVTIDVLSQTTRFADRVRVATLTVSRIDFSRERIVFYVQDRRRLLNASLLPQSYAGDSSSYEGGAEQEGTPKPLLIGKRANIEPVAVDDSPRRFQFCHYFPAAGVDQIRIAGAVLPVSTWPTIDLDRGMLQFASAPAGDVSITARGCKPRNPVRRPRDATLAGWTLTNCTAEALPFGVDGEPGGFILTATANNARAVPTLNESPGGWPGAVESVYYSALQGTGTFRFIGMSASIQAEADWNRTYRQIDNDGVSPSLSVKGIEILNAGDRIKFDFYTFEPGTYRPSPPMDGGASTASNTADEPASALKLLFTTFSGYVPHLDFDEDAAALVAQMVSDQIGLYYKTPVTVLQAAERILESFAGTVRVDGQGRIVFGRLGLAERAPVAALTRHHLMTKSQRVRIDQRVYRVEVLYRENDFIQQGFSSSVAMLSKQIWATQWLTAFDEDESIGAYIGTNTEEILQVETALYETEAASRLARFYRGLVGVRRQLLELYGRAEHLLGIFPGDVVRVSLAPLTHPRTDATPSYADGIVTAKRIDQPSGEVMLEVYI